MNFSSKYIISHSPRIAPCRFACPIGQNPQEYIACIAEGRFDDAVSAIRKENPFPSICGRFCSRPCEFECTLFEKQDSVSIKELKRFAGDIELQIANETFPDDFYGKPCGAKVGVIGAGLSGLGAAYFLRMHGCEVSVFESLPFPGGLIALSSPESILPSEILQKEIDFIKKCGVQIFTEKKAGRDFSIEELISNGMDAILIAVGAPVSGIKPAIWESKNLKGFLEPYEWLVERKLNGFNISGAKVLIDGLNTLSILWAILAKEDGAERVTIITSHSLIPASTHSDLIENAIQKGVEIKTDCTTQKLVERRGKISGCLITEKTSGGRKNKSLRLPVDFYIPAGVRFFDETSSKTGFNFKISKWNLLEVDSKHLVSGYDRIFGAGEAVMGSRNTIDIIASGKISAGHILNFLKIKNNLLNENERKKGLIFYDATLKEHLISNKILIPEKGIREREPRKKRVSITTRMEAMEEARRCLRCGACTECDTCHHYCSWKIYTIPETSKTLSNKDGESKFIRVRKLSQTQKSKGVDFINEMNELLPVHANVEPDLCDGCGSCEKVCPYSVASTFPVKGLTEPPLSKIDSDSCRGCGICVSACPNMAISCPGFDFREALSVAFRIASSLPSAPIVLRCRWSGSLQGENEIAVDCAGRIPSWLILKILEFCSAGIKIIGCGEKCHHKNGMEIGKARTEAIIKGFESYRIDSNILEIKESSNEEQRNGQGIEREIGQGSVLQSLSIKEEIGQNLSMPVGAIESGIKSFAIISSKSETKDFEREKTEPQSDIVYFPGCIEVAGYLSENQKLREDISNYHNSAIALIKNIYNMENVRVIKGCCGLPFSREDEIKTKEVIRKKLLEKFISAGAKRVVVSCMDCFNSLKSAEEFKGLKITHIAEAFAGKVVEKVKDNSFSDDFKSLPDKVAILQSSLNLEAEEIVISVLKKFTEVCLFPSPQQSNRNWQSGERNGARRRLEIVNEAQKQKAKTLLLTSNSQFYYFSRDFSEGTWRAGLIEIKSLHGFLEEILKREQRRIKE